MKVRPKKYYGQHFLKNPATAKRISDSLPSDARFVLEIGPGMGILTKPLYQRFGQNLKVIEIDHEAITYLQDEFGDFHNNIIRGDFLKQDITNLFPDQFQITGNFPYNISSQILFRMLEHKDNIPSLTGMFQKEVAQRIVSQPGSRIYGILSVLTQAFYQAQIIFTLSENEFSPPPKVESAVIQLIRKENYSLDCNEALFFKVVKTAFQQRRKTLRNSLKSLLQDIELPQHISSSRPEQLGVKEFEEITRRLQGLTE
ncbi:MAG: 16S rRNA (adenine(1518)-N(6)/adenine(1519)-N(6))-dimethyltransferase RsmA [Bacteroidales bacterium]